MPDAPNPLALGIARHIRKAKATGLFPAREFCSGAANVFFDPEDVSLAPSEDTATYGRRRPPGEQIPRSPSV